MESTLVNRLLNIGGGSGLLQLDSNATSRMLLGTSCSNNVGAFAISIGPEGSYKGAAASGGLMLTVGCKNSVVDADLRLFAYGGVSVPTQPDVAGSIGWVKEFPGDYDDDMNWFGGVNKLALGVTTSPVWSFVSFRNTPPYVFFDAPEFTGVFVDFSIPENADRFQDANIIKTETFVLAEQDESEDTRAVVDEDESKVAGGGIGIGFEFTFKFFHINSGTFSFAGLA